jgi:uncharacterized delta-60 repeat protein
MIRNKGLIYLFAILLTFFSIIAINSFILAQDISRSYTYNSNHLKLSSSEEWIRTWGLNGSDHGYAVAIDSNGDIYLGGEIEIDGSSNASLVKYNSLGEYQWDRSWGGLATDYINSIYIDSSDNIYITGKARSFGISDDIFLVKYDTVGNLIWNRTWGSATENDIGTDLFVDDQGNIFVAGFTSGFGVDGQDFLFIKFNSTGDFQWYETWGGFSDDRAKSIDYDSEGNIFLMGETGSFGMGNSEVGLVCYNSLGVLQWNTTWGTSTLDRPQSMVVDSNNNIYTSGFTYHPDIGTGDTHFFILKLSNSGIPIWSKIWGSPYMDLGVCLALDSLGNIFFLGSTEGYEAGIQDMYLTKFNSEGDREWETLWDSGDYDSAHDIIIDQSTNDIYLAGESSGFTIEKDLQMILIKNPSFPEANQDPNNNNGIPGYNLVVIIVFTSFCTLTLIYYLNKKRFK